jgi:predicted RNA binding protein YcfA (HicA-like mRNA interferase family)
MSKNLSIDNCRNSRDFDQAIRHSGLRVEERQNGSSHRVYKFPDTGVSVPIPQHNGDIPIGTRRSIAKRLILAGLVAMPFILCNMSRILAVFGLEIV